MVIFPPEQKNSSESTLDGDMTELTGGKTGALMTLRSELWSSSSTVYSKMSNFVLISGPTVWVMALLLFDCNLIPGPLEHRYFRRLNCLRSTWSDGNTAGCAAEKILLALHQTNPTDPPPQGSYRGRKQKWVWKNKRKIVDEEETSASPHGCLFQKQNRKDDAVIVVVVAISNSNRTLFLSEWLPQQNNIHK